MILPVATLVIAAATWLLNKAVPTAWHHYADQPSKEQLRVMEELCEKHQDCEALHLYSLRGLQTQSKEKP